jgi:hypothetical protein
VLWSKLFGLDGPFEPALPFTYRERFGGSMSDEQYFSLNRSTVKKKVIEPPMIPYVFFVSTEPSGSGAANGGAESNKRGKESGQKDSEAPRTMFEAYRAMLVGGEVSQVDMERELAMMLGSIKTRRGGRRPRPGPSREQWGQAMTFVAPSTMPSLVVPLSLPVMVEDADVWVE